MENDNLNNFGLIDLTYTDKRMFELRKTVVQLISQYNPEAILWEDLKGNRNIDTVRKLGEPTGILRELSEEFAIPYYEYKPVTVKSVCCYTNNKIKLGMYIAEKYGLMFPKDEIFKVVSKGKNKGTIRENKNHPFLNITDAIALGLCHYLIIKRCSNGTETTKEKKRKKIQESNL